MPQLWKPATKRAGSHSCLEKPAALPHFPQPRRRSYFERLTWVGPFRSIGVGSFYVVETRQYIAYFSLDPTVGNQDLWYVELTEGAEPQILLKTPFDETLPQFSPDGKYVAFQSNQSGRWKIFLARFPSGEVLEQVSINGGIHPKWSPQGDELFYLEENTLTSVAVETEPALELGLPEALFDIEQVGMRLSLRDGASYPTYTVGENAERFIVVQTVQPLGATGSNVVVVLNWFEELKERVPVP